MLFIRYVHIRFDASSKGGIFVIKKILPKIHLTQKDSTFQKYHSFG